MVFKVILEEKVNFEQILAGKANNSLLAILAKKSL